ncbi:MAG: SpoIVB peptidase [Lachnospiraceae bacterium]|nr:SpoIVB peptidase [Lachnospiraceae bacterium]
MTWRVVYRRMLKVLLTVSLTGMAGLLYYGYWTSVPDHIWLEANKEQTLDLGVPANGILEQGYVEMDYQQADKTIPVNLGHAVSIQTGAVNSYQMDLKLWGILPFKQVQVDVVQEQTVIPGGEAIGIYVSTEGNLVIDTGSFIAENGMTTEPAKYVLKKGDYILSVNGVSVHEKSEFKELVANSDGKEMILTISRDGETFDVSVTPVPDETGAYKLGIWIKDNAQGIGTLSFLTANGNFGALGHGINDTDTGQLMELQNGALYRTNIISIMKGSVGTPGELTGLIDYTKGNRLGTILKNTEKGIFGYCDGDQMMEPLREKAVPLGFRQEVKKGLAEIICSVEGKPHYYDVEIEAIHLDEESDNRQIEIAVTDERLLQITGGIVQGMSGSPILQNGKMVGVVTLVFVDDPIRGYDIFAEEMLEEL